LGQTLLSVAAGSLYHDNDFIFVLFRNLAMPLKCFTCTTREQDVAASL
jgi:hypothetical protein